MPNIFTFIRILLIPFLMKYLLAGNYLLAGFMFAFSAFTDFLDGYFARRYNMVTKFGRILDPLADKLTIISILFVLNITNIVPKYIAIIILVREIFVLLGSCIIFFLGVDVINPSKIGKISMALLYVAIVLRILHIEYIDMALFYIVIPLTIISGINYIIAAYKEIFN